MYIKLLLFVPFAISLFWLPFAAYHDYKIRMNARKRELMRRRFFNQKFN